VPPDPIKRVTLELGGKSPKPPLSRTQIHLADAIPGERMGDLCVCRPILRSALAALLVEKSMYDDVVRAGDRAPSPSR